MKSEGPLAVLSKRERLVAAKFAEGLTHRKVGELLFIAPATVRTHLAKIYRKLGIHNKATLVRLFADHPTPEQGQSNERPTFRPEEQSRSRSRRATEVTRRTELGSSKLCAACQRLSSWEAAGKGGKSSYEPSYDI